MARQPVTIHYRRLQDVTGALNGQTLERAVRTAMGHRHNGNSLSDQWNLRAWLIPPSDDETLLMNIFHDGGNHFFGDLTQYTQGYMQALIGNQGNVPMLNVEQEPPPDGKEYVHSMMYWMVIDDHVLIIQSRSLTAKRLEEYLTWLLKDRTTTIDQTGQIILQAKFDAADVGGDLDDIREIIVGGGTPVESAGVAVEPRAPEAREVDVYRELEERRPWQERAIDVLRIVMRSDADVEELLESIPDDADLDVSVHIGYKARRRRVSRAPMQQALRNLPEGEITAVGKHGRLTGQDIRLSYPARITKDGSLLNLEDTRRALREAYTYFVENGKIEA